MSKTLTLEECQRIILNLELYRDDEIRDSISPQQWQEIKDNHTLDKFIDENGSLVLPEGIKEIPYGMFYDNQELKSITIPDSVTRIGFSAFERCNNLTEIIGGNGVRNIGENALNNNWYKKQPDGVV